jgi:phosphatidate cytidylyltransferase
MEKSGIILKKYPFLASAVALELSYILFKGRYSTLVFWIVVLLPLVLYLPEGELKKSFAALFGILYIPYLLHFFYRIYERDVFHAFLVLAMVWCYEMGAFIVGSLWGRHKIAPSLSPNKSIEGVLGGVVFVLIGAGLLAPLWEPNIYGLPLIVLSLAVSVATQVGDLFESKLKRIAKVKDSGRFFPGHGGMLDRLDGLLFAFPVFYFYLHYVGLI